MPTIKYRVTLSDEEVEMLETVLRKGKSAARKQTRARILLKAAAGCKDAEIMKALSARCDKPIPAQRAPPPERTRSIDEMVCGT